MTSSPAKTPIKGTPLIHADFIVTGVVVTLLGPALPLLSVRWGLNDARAGSLFLVQYITSTIGMLLSGVLVERLGSRRTLLAGLILMAAGVCLLAHAGWLLGFTAVAIYGVGFGSNTPTGNLYIAETNPASRAVSLNLLNAAWGIGAMLCPLLVATAQRARQLPLFLYLTGGVLLALAAVFLRVRFVDDGKRSGEPLPGVKTDIWNNRSVPLIASLFFVYVGTETAMGGWVAMYARRLDFSSHAFWAMTPSFFWGALLVGRMAAPILLRRLREMTVASLGLVIAAGGVSLVLAASSLRSVVIGAALAGLGLAAVFPISVSLLTHWFGEMASRVSGAIFSLGNLGGAALPWSMGVISARSGSLRAAFVVPLLGSIFMLAIYVISGRAARGGAVDSRDTA